jgi:DNA repair protein RecO (recombination protein O)
MGYIKTKGIILREVNTGEADKIVTVFSRNQGKLTGSAKGARRPKNKLAAGTQFLCYSDFVLFKGKDMYSISSCDIIEPFYEIRNDIFKLTYTAHMVDLISDVIQENQPSSRVLQLFLNTLHLLSKTDKQPELLIRIFEIRFLTILGYAPYVKDCAECGSCDPESRHYFSFKKCGVICEECKIKDPNAMDISNGTVNALRHIVYAKLENLFSFELSPFVLNELGRITKRYLKERLERDYTKLDFLKTLENPL